MREHKGLYRGKEINTGLWMRGYYVCLHDSKGNVSHRIYNAYAETDCGDYYPDWFEVDPDTVGECTGLRDKNGKLIFEGDIVKVKHGMFRMNADGFKEQKIRTSYGKHIVECELGGCRCYYWRNYAVSIHDGQVKIKNGSDFHHIKWSYIYNHELEIIGNIHDNPELLKGGDTDE